MTDPITFDQFPLNCDVSWSQESLQIPFNYHEAISQITSHNEVLSLEKKPTHLEKLFALNETLDTWANFTPPHNFYKQSNRFFHKTLFPSLKIEELIERFHLLDSSIHITGDTFEQEKIGLTCLLEQLEFLSAILEEIHTKMLQYRKG